MKESHNEGVANRIGPESCGEAREGLAEALTGENTGREDEPRKGKLRDADALTECGRQHSQHRQRQGLRGSRGRRSWHVWTRIAREPGDPGFARAYGSGRIGKSMGKRR